MTMLLIVIINSGVFVEIENSMSISEIIYSDFILTIDGTTENLCKLPVSLVFEAN